jgi:hypothetical protein
LLENTFKTQWQFFETLSLRETDTINFASGFIIKTCPPTPRCIPFSGKFDPFFHGKWWIKPFGKYFKRKNSQFLGPIFQVCALLKNARIVSLLVNANKNTSFTDTHHLQVF